MPTKHKMTRAEAIACFEKHMPLSLRSKELIDFYIEAGMLEIVENPKIELVWETNSLKDGTIRLERWPEGLVLWCGGVIQWKQWVK